MKRELAQFGIIEYELVLVTEGNVLPLSEWPSQVPKTPITILVLFQPTFESLNLLNPLVSSYRRRSFHALPLLEAVIRKFESSALSPGIVPDIQTGLKALAVVGQQIVV